MATFLLRASKLVACPFLPWRLPSSISQQCHDNYRPDFADKETEAVRGVAVSSQAHNSSMAASGLELSFSRRAASTPSPLTSTHRWAQAHVAVCLYPPIGPPRQLVVRRCSGHDAPCWDATFPVGVSGIIGAGGGGK